MINYKKIISSRALRLKILSYLSFVPDKLMIQIQYWLKTGRKLNLDNPVRFTEKLQWYKLYYKNPLMIKCVDKYDVRDYVKSKGLEDILIPCYGVFDSPKDIDWDNLPNQFVMKDTLGGGGTSVILVKDKSKVDTNELKEIGLRWVSEDAHRKNGGREWPYYSGKKHRIIIEEYLESQEVDTLLTDYKFFCFNGVPEWIYVIADRSMGNGASVGIYDSNFIKKDARRLDEKPLNKVVKKPINFELMKEISSQLSKDFLHARIDLYEVNGYVRFGEITFYDGSGYMEFKPDDFDYEIGKEFMLPEKSEM